MYTLREQTVIPTLIPHVNGLFGCLALGLVFRRASLWGGGAHPM
jgi:hypothetical protein